MSFASLLRGLLHHEVTGQMHEYEYDYRYPAPCNYVQDRLRRRVHGFEPVLWILRLRCACAE